MIPDRIPREGTVTTRVARGAGDDRLWDHRLHGPCPPQGETHRYQFKVYGLDAMLTLPAGSDKHALVAAMKGHVLQFGETVALCTR